MSASEEVLAILPQKPPFLFIDEVVEKSATSLHARRKLREDEEFFKGHFPGMPIMPGVLFLESMFQAGALLMSERAGDPSKVGVVTRVDGVKFKRFAKPGDVLDIKVDFEEELGGAFFFKGKVMVDGKASAACRFGCTLVDPTALKGE